jgi:hypothetical protein
LRSLDWKKLELVYLEEEKPLLSSENNTLGDEEKTRLDNF